MDTLSKAERIISAALNSTKNHSARSRLEDITFASTYAEPDYSDPKSGVIAFGNWNSISRYNTVTGKFDTIDDTLPRVTKLLEKLGVELEWEDEWTTCNDCGGAIRTEPTSYGWQRSYVELDGDIVCQECLAKSKGASKDYLLSLERQSNRCTTIDLDLAEFGYRRVEREFENGLHGGQSDSPVNIGAELKRQGISRYLFSLDSSGQFDIRFSVWIHESEYDLLDLAEFCPSSGVDPAEMMKRALKAVPTAEVGLPDGPGVKVIKCNLDDGTATARLVSPQDFADGKALDKEEVDWDREERIHGEAHPEDYPDEN